MTQFLPSALALTALLVLLARGAVRLQRVRADERDATRERSPRP